MSIRPVRCDSSAGVGVMTARALGLRAGWFLLLLALASCTDMSKSAVERRAKAESEIRQMEREWADTAVTGDVSVIERILAEDFLGTSPEGVLYTKRDFLRDMNAHPSEFTANHLNDVKVRFFDDVAVAQGNETFTRRNGKMERFVWTDVLVRREGRWQIVAAEDLIAPVAAQQSSGGLFLNETSGAGNAGVDQDITEIKKTRTAYVSAWKAGNAVKVANLYTDDALVLYPNLPAVAGKSAILGYFRGFFAEFRQEAFELVSAEVRIVGSWAFDRGTYRWRGVPRAGGEPSEDHGKYLVILERQPEGSWKVARDMDNSDRPLAQRTRAVQAP